MEVAMNPYIWQDVPYIIAALGIAALVITVVVWLIRLGFRHDTPIAGFLIVLFGFGIWWFDWWLLPEFGWSWKYFGMGCLMVALGSWICYTTYRLDWEYRLQVGVNQPHYAAIGLRQDASMANYMGDKKRAQQLYEQANKIDIPDELKTLDNWDDWYAAYKRTGCTIKPIPRPTWAEDNADPGGLVRGDTRDMGGNVLQRWGNK